MWIPIWPKLAAFLGVFFFVFLLIFAFILVRKIIEFLLKKGNRKLSIIIRKDVDIALFIAGICASILLIVSFFAPNVLSVYPLELPQSSNLATTMNGFMSPFIAIAAAILTFMAFWVQYTANANIHEENKKQQDERQFYEMLKIHRDNVDKLEFVHLESEEEANYLRYIQTPSNMPPPLLSPFLHEKRHNLIRSKGQTAIRLYLDEFLCIYETLKPLYMGRYKECFQEAYSVFFNGFTCTFLKNHKCTAQNQICIQSSSAALLCQKKIGINKTMGGVDNIPQSSIMDGRKAVLNPYYRHLYLTVRSVVDSNFTRDEKENFLNILRASLTAEEQSLLLFNWYYGKIRTGGYGYKWEDKNHKYFSEWRMIHNIVEKDIEMVFNDLKKHNEKSSFDVVKRLLETDRDLGYLFEEFK